MATLVDDSAPPASALASGSVRAEAGNIAAMDGLRGVSVAWIVLFHFVVLRAGSDPWADAIGAAPVVATLVAHGPFAVDLFFLISGFLLTLPWLIRAREGRPAPDARAFYIRRLRRIAPAYYVNVLALFVLVMPLLHGIAYWRSDLYVYLFNAVAHGLFVHNMTPLTSGSLGVNGALWTLAIEAQFYALLPLLAPAFARAPARCLAAATAISVAWVAGAHHGFDGLVGLYLDLGRHWQWSEDSIRRLLAIQFPAYLAHFALGAGLAHAWLARPAAIARWSSAIIAACAAVLAAIASGLWRPLGEQAWLVSLLALGGIVLACAASRGWAARALGRGPLAFIGRVSYSVYLWHLPLLLLLQARTAAGGLAFFPLYLACVVAIGWLSWRWVEQPFMRARAPARLTPRSAP